MTRPLGSFKRPIAVSLAGLVAVSVAVFHVLHGLNQLREGSPAAPPTAIPAWDWSAAASEAWLRSVVEVGLAVLALVVAFNFLLLRRWAWVALVLWVTINLTIDLIAYFYADAKFLSMIVTALLAFAVIQADVQIIFGIRRTEEAHAV